MIPEIGGPVSVNLLAKWLSITTLNEGFLTLQPLAIVRPVLWDLPHAVK